MNARWFFLLAAVLLVLGLAVQPSMGQTSLFIITNADDTNYVGLVNEPNIPLDVESRMIIQYANAVQYYNLPPVDVELRNLLQQVAPRFVVQYANGMKYYTIPPLDAQLSTLVQQVTPKFTVQYANAMKYYPIPPVNADLLGFMQQVAPKFTIQYANANKYYTLGYPAELIGDTAAPQISGLAVRKLGGNVVISWSSNELAKTVFRFGTQSGNLSQNATDDSFRTLHQATVGGYLDGTTYYYTIQHIDRSGNVFQSSEYSFSLRSVFLPMIRR